MREVFETSLSDVFSVLSLLQFAMVDGRMFGVSVGVFFCSCWSESESKGLSG